MPEIPVQSICIPIEEYKRLLRAKLKLKYLQAHGVDNWEGYSEAIQDMIEAENSENTETLMTIIQG
jgi:hypothetical protein